MNRMTLLAAASACALIASPAWAVLNPVRVSSEIPAENISSITLSIGGQTVEAVPVAQIEDEEDRNRMGGAYFAADIPSGATSGAATIRMKDGTVLRDAPVRASGGVISVLAPPRGGDLGPRNLWTPGAYDTPRLSIGISAEADILDLGGEVEMGAEVISGPIIFDRGFGTFRMNPRMYGFRAEAEADLGPVSIGFDYSRATGEDSVQISEPEQSDPGVSRGFTFLQEDATFGTGVSLGLASLDGDADVNAKRNRWRFDVGLQALDFTSRGDKWRLYPTVGYERSKTRYEVTYLATLSNSLGSLTNMEWIDLQTKINGPYVGFNLEHYCNPFSDSREIGWFVGVDVAHREAKGLLDVTQTVESQISYFPLSVQQIQRIEEEEDYFTPILSAGVRAELIAGLSLQARYEYRSDYYFEYRRESDGNGRPLAPQLERQGQHTANVGLRFRF